MEFSYANFGKIARNLVSNAICRTIVHPGRVQLIAVCVFAFSFQSSLALAEEPNASCAETLKSLDWTLEKRWEYFELNSDRAGAALLGVACSKDEIVSWFEKHGWELESESTRTGELFGPPDNRFRSDFGLSFCLPRGLPMRALGANCSAFASTAFYQGRITDVFAVASK